MNPFAVVNEFSVLAVTLLMMCVSTLWYSKYLFGDLWEKESKVTPPEGRVMLSASFFTFISYFVLLLGIAYSVAVAQVVSIPLPFLSLGFWVGSLAVLLPAYVWEQRSMRLFFISSGFFAVFIFGGTYLISSWIW